MEGGLSSWKSFRKNRASIRIPSHAAGDYRNLKEPLSQNHCKKPLPQSHCSMTWCRDRVTRDWLLLEKNEASRKKGMGEHCNDQQNKIGIRTMSSSTLDSDEGSYLRMNDEFSYSQDDVELIEHIVLPSDTIQGICIQYKISATKLRQVNIFSGSSLKLAPKRLLIPVPISKLKLNSSFHSSDSSSSIRMQDRTTKVYKVHKLICECPTLTTREIEAYLSLHNDDLKSAMNEALSDLEWEKTQNPQETIGSRRPPLSLHKVLASNVERQTRSGDGCSHGKSERKRKHLIELQPMKDSNDNWEDISVPQSYKSVQDLTLQASGRNPLESRPIHELIISIPLSAELRKRRTIHESSSEFGIELKEIANQTS